MYMRRAWRVFDLREGSPRSSQTSSHAMLRDLFSLAEDNVLPTWMAMMQKTVIEWLAAIVTPNVTRNHDALLAALRYLQVYGVGDYVPERAHELLANQEGFDVEIEREWLVEEFAQRQADFVAGHPNQSMPDLEIATWMLRCNRVAKASKLAVMTWLEAEIVEGRVEQGEAMKYSDLMDEFEECDFRTKWDVRP